MSNQIILVVESDIVPGKVDELKALIEKLSEHVQKTEPDLRTYLFHFNEDNTECRLIEHYDNSDALFVHLQNLAAFREDLDSCLKRRTINVYGNPSEKLRAAFTRLKAEFYPNIGGMVR